MKLLATRNINYGASNFVEKDRAKRRVMKYNMHNDVLMFHNLVVLRLEERKNIVHVYTKRLGILVNNKLLQR